jgi:hypothetical protein
MMKKEAEVAVGDQENGFEFSATEDCWRKSLSIGMLEPFGTGPPATSSQSVAIARELPTSSIGSREMALAAFHHVQNTIEQA